MDQSENVSSGSTSSEGDRPQEEQCSNVPDPSSSLDPSGCMSLLSYAAQACPNSLCPAVFLPAEILSIIFRHCVACHAYWIPRNPLERLYNGNLALRKYFAFSRVCQRWRDIAISDPSLWTEPTTSHYYMASQMLRRSQNMPLKVEIHMVESTDYYQEKDHEIAKKVFEEFSRFKDLSMSGKLHDVRRLMDLIQAPSHMLKYLDLEVTDSVGFLPYNGVWHMLPLGTVFLRCCPFPIQSGFYHNLRTLSLHGCSDRLRWPITHILQMLRQNLTLFDLRLSHIIDVGAGPAASDSDDVRLTHLKDLELIGPALAWSYVLAKLQAPNLENLVISHPTSIESHPEECERLGVHLRHVLFQAEEKPLLSLECWEDICNTHFQFDLPDVMHETKSVVVTLSYPDAHRSPCVFEQLTHFLSSWSLQNLTSLLISSEDDNNGTVFQFIDRLSTLQSLTRLELRTNEAAVIGLLNALADPAKFPYLTLVEIVEVDMEDVLESLAEPQALNGRELSFTLRKCKFQSETTMKNYQQMNPSVHIIDPVLTEHERSTSEETWSTLQVPVGYYYGFAST